MKLLIVREGMNRFDEALNDLRSAGLPLDAAARVVSAGPMMIPAGESMVGVNQTFTLFESKIEEAVDQACRRLQEIFPEWEVQGFSVIHPPALEILGQAEEWQPDLIVVGADGRSLLERIFSSSVSRALVKQAPCSVRVARGRAKSDDRFVRLLIGVDGSQRAKAAVREVASRSWPVGTEARLVTSIGPVFNLPADMLETEHNYAQSIQNSAADILRAAGLDVSQVVREDDATQTILSEAENWQADCIFVGQSGLGFVKRMFLGSVSSAVAAQAKRSVEVVRTDKAAPRVELWRDQNWLTFDHKSR
jgi:nucleotide-binding universal stress UspA family protein